MGKNELRIELIITINGNTRGLRFNPTASQKFIDDENMRNFYINKIMSEFRKNGN